MNILALLVNYLNGAYVAEYAPERGKKMIKKCPKCGKPVKENTDGNLKYCQGH